MMKLFVPALLVTLCAALPAHAEETVWVSHSTRALTVSENRDGWLISNGKARFLVRDGDRLPAVFQTDRGKVLRAGRGPKR
ncbi:MAG: hypothetical protein ACKO5K_02290 [Armatimonadota bacterium]